MASFEELTLILPDGYKAYARYWAPADAIGAVLYHHGIQSHCGWYESSAARLAEAGFAVMQVDRRGNGRNRERRGHATSSDELIDDALAGRNELARRSGLTDHHVVGVSWGGKLAVAAYVKDPAGVKSLSLVTPGLFPRVGVSKDQMAKIGFAMIYQPEQLFDIPLNEAELFTAVPRWQRFFNTDELTIRQCTAGFYLASRRMDRMAVRLGVAPPVPVHLFVAEDEHIIDNEKTTAFINGLNWPDCVISRYADARHSLEFEGDPNVYFENLVSFIHDRQRREAASTPS